MEYSCCGSGEIMAQYKDSCDDDKSQNTCQLNIETVSCTENRHSLRMNQLFQWKHYVNPFNAELVQVKLFF